MHIFKANTITDLHEDMVWALSQSPRERVDDDISISVTLHNVLAEAKSMEWDFPLHKLWYSKARWGALVSQYINKGAYESWLDSISTGLAVKKSARGIATLRTNMVAPRPSGRGLTRRWGSCILAYSYRQYPFPQITMHSRTSYLGYIGALDLSLAYCLGREVSGRTGIPLEAMHFSWQLAAAQFHPMRSCGAHFYFDRKRFLGFRVGNSRAREVCPGIYHSRKWFDKWRELDNEGVLYADMPYNTMARFRRRFHTEILGYGYGEQFEDERMRRFKPIVPFYPRDLAIQFSKTAQRAEGRPDHVEVDYDGDCE